MTGYQKRVYHPYRRGVGRGPRGHGPDEEVAANGETVCFADLTLDGSYAKSTWGYEDDIQVRSSGSLLVYLYTDLVEQYLTNLITLYDVNSYESYQYISYTDDGVTAQEITVGPSTG